MTYALGRTSLANLSGVHPDLVRVVKRAIQTTRQDFSVFEGLRSEQRQLALLKSGASRVKRGKHQRQDDGFGHAVDLLPFIDGMPRWEWGAIWAIADAMRDAAIEENVRLRWGGVWDRKLNLLQDGVDGLKAAVEAYKVRHPGPDFLDGPHYELVL